MYSRFVKNQQKTLLIKIILSSVRPQRNADRVCSTMKTILSTFDCKVDVIDPMELDLRVMDVPLHFYQKEEDIPEWLKNLNESIKESDALIVVTAEYNRTAPPALINLLDYVPFTSFQYKPVGIVSYSAGAGGAGSISQLKSVLSYLGCIIIPLSPNITNVDKKINTYGDIDPDCVENRGMYLMVQQLQYITNALLSWNMNNKTPPTRL